MHPSSLYVAVTLVRKPIKIDTPIRVNATTLYSTDLIMPSPDIDYIKCITVRKCVQDGSYAFAQIHCNAIKTALRKTQG